MQQKILDDIVEANCSLQYFLSQAQNTNKSITVQIQDIDKNVTLLCQQKRLLLMNPQSTLEEKSQATATLKGNLASLLKTASTEEINPSTLHELGINIEGDLGFIQRFSEAMKGVSIIDTLNNSGANIFGNLPAKFITDVLIDLFANLSNRKEALKRHGLYIAEKTKLSEKLVTQTQYLSVQQELYEQHLKIQKIKYKIERLLITHSDKTNINTD